MRVGVGYDIHPFKKGKPFVLGGLRIPGPKGLAGHSDGDALHHAVVDAVLGALGAGDIGEHFPDTDRRYKGAASRVFVDGARRLLRQKNFKIENIDTTLIVESPKLGPWKGKIRRSLARDWGVDVASVNVKAKTNEGFGALGRGEALAVLAVISLTKTKR